LDNEEILNIRAEPVVDVGQYLPLLRHVNVLFTTFKERTGMANREIL
jgi:hypothetical protein